MSRPSAPSNPEGRSGAVVAAHQAAAEAGAQALRAGGSAVDAAVAAGFALTVVDAAGCGLGGYGGFLTYGVPGGGPMVVDFNTFVPDGVDPEGFPSPGDDVRKLDGGASVAPPQVVSGLVAAHERFGRLPLADVVAPAIRLAADGFAVGRTLARALASHRERTAGGAPAFAEIFYPGGRVPRHGDRLVQTDLAGTLEAVAADGAAVFRGGPVADAICTVVQADGGVLQPGDLARETVSVAPAATIGFESAIVSGPPSETSGAGVVFEALATVDPARLGPNREAGYVAELTRALASAWRTRIDAAGTAAAAQHTTTASAVDRDGGVVAVTFTHGSLWFGSGLVAPGTGVVLNAGANLYARTPSGPSAVTNMSPVVIEQQDGARHAFGAVGGPRIPGIVLTEVVDAVHYDLTLADALAAPHLSVRPHDGVVQAEAELVEAGRATSTLRPGDSGFGAAAGATWTAEGCAAAVDPRFDGGAAFA